MSDTAVGNCLQLYLKNYALIDSLEEQEALPPELKPEEQLLSSFGERARDQAAALLEALYSRLISGGALPYRVQRRSQRRTVREQWRMDGPFLRPREKMARNFWSLYLGCLRDKGPAACLVVGPNEPDNPIAIEGLSGQVAAMLGLESANPRFCFSHDSDYETGIVLGFAPLSPPLSHGAIADSVKEHLDKFFTKHREQLEHALDSA